MMLYLTGGASSLAKNSEVPQDDPMRSLGGYISTSPVPNAALNTIFDCISLQTLKECLKETIAIALVNKFDKPVRDVYIRTVVSPDNIAKFRIAAVPIGEDMCMEHIYNRYAEPVMAEFVDVSYVHAFVDFDIKTPFQVGEDIYFEQFEVLAEITEPDLEGNIKALKKAFKNSREYELKQLSNKRFRITSKTLDETLEPFLPTYISSDPDGKLEFIDEFKLSSNTAFLAEKLEPNQAVGLWIQRDISNYKERTNEEIIKDTDDGYVFDIVEDMELIIDYEDEEDIEDKDDIENNEQEQQ